MPFYTNLANAQADGLLSYWAFDEPSGATIADPVGGRDLTANNYNSHPIDGTVVKTPLGNGRDVTAYWVSGDANTDTISYSFGTTTYDSNAPSISAYTLRALFKYKGDPGSGQQQVIGCVGHSKHYFAIDSSDGLLYFWTDGINDWIKSNIQPAAGQRYDLVATYDGTTVEFFVNDVSQGTLTGTDSIALDAYQGTFGDMIGAASNSNFASWANVVLDDVGIWNRTLSSSEVATLYNSGTPLAVFSVPQGTLTLPIEINVFQGGAIALPVEIDVQSNQGALALPVAIDVGALGSLGVPVSVNVYDQTQAPPETWGFQVVIDSVDWTDALVGKIVIDGEEGAARVATLSLFAGTTFNPNDWINNRIEIHYLRAGVEYPLFNGLVDTPDLDMTTGEIRLSCTDNLQATVENATLDQVAAAVGGQYHNAVFGEPTNSWDYAQSRLETQAASYDLDINGAGRVGQWHQAVPDFTFTDDDYIADSLSVQFGSRRDLVNSVQITFDYRFQHYRERRINESWGWGRNFLDYLKYNTSVPSGDMVQQAISSTGWKQVGTLQVDHLPATQDVLIPSEGRHIEWVNPDNVRKQQVISARFSLATRWVQSVTETHTLTVQDSPNIAVTGLLQETQSYSLDLSTSVDGFEQFTADPQLSGGVIGNDLMWSSGDASEFASAMAVAAARAKVRIQASHRENVVAFTKVLEPTLERYHHARLQTTRLTAQGKVSRVRHTLDLESGQDLTDIEISVFRRLASNSADTPYDVATFNYGEFPAQVIFSLSTHYGGNGQSVPDDQSWDGYVGNYTPEGSGEVYQERFVAIAPQIDAASRDPVEKQGSETFEVAVWQDDLVINP